MKGFKNFMFLFILMLSMPMMLQAQTDRIEKSTVETLNKSDNFAIGVSGERQLKSAYSMYQKFQNSGVKLKRFEIVIWGAVVKDLKKGTELHDYIKAQEVKGLQVTVCQIALDYFDVSKEDLPYGIKVVPDAHVRLFELQALGYNLIVI
ncbi:DsrE family protein [Psychroflexus halocasei]|uniref:DsrE/DsrF-like family protein n=1 Tax=Psychroflexus halocasei TaxID=908615 RepID=A0A1H3ZQG7_9FLAO|nr:DsrE family protein [Psychroflexus halocasei]SEA25928.1 DsrE/DsrF-like family protein [Psychroflexus halocasei]